MPTTTFDRYYLPPFLRPTYDCYYSGSRYVQCLVAPSILSVSNDKPKNQVPVQGLARKSRDWLAKGALLRKATRNSHSICPQKLAIEKLSGNFVKNLIPKALRRLYLKTNPKTALTSPFQLLQISHSPETPEILPEALKYNARKLLPRSL